MAIDVLKKYSIEVGIINNASKELDSIEKELTNIGKDGKLVSGLNDQFQGVVKTVEGLKGRIADLSLKIADNTQLNEMSSTFQRTAAEISESTRKINEQMESLRTAVSSLTSGDALGISESVKKQFNDILTTIDTFASKYESAMQLINASQEKGVSFDSLAEAIKAGKKDVTSGLEDARKEIEKELQRIASAGIDIFDQTGLSDLELFDATGLQSSLQFIKKITSNLQRAGVKMADVNKMLMDIKIGDRGGLNLSYLKALRTQMAEIIADETQVTKSVGSASEKINEVRFRYILDENGEGTNSVIKKIKKIIETVQRAVNKDFIKIKIGYEYDDSEEEEQSKATTPEAKEKEIIKKLIVKSEIKRDQVLDQVNNVIKDVNKELSGKDAPKIKLQVEADLKEGSFSDLADDVSSELKERGVSVDPSTGRVVTGEVKINESGLATEDTLKQVLEAIQKCCAQGGAPGGGGTPPSGGGVPKPSDKAVASVEEALDLYLAESLFRLRKTGKHTSKNERGILETRSRLLEGLYLRRQDEEQLNYVIKAAKKGDLEALKKTDYYSGKVTRNGVDYAKYGTNGETLADWQKAVEQQFLTLSKAYAEAAQKAKDEFVTRSAQTKVEDPSDVTREVQGWQAQIIETFVDLQKQLDKSDSQTRKNFEQHYRKEIQAQADASGDTFDVSLSKLISQKINAMIERVINSRSAKDFVDDFTPTVISGRVSHTGDEILDNLRSKYINRAADPALSDFTNALNLATKGIQDLLADLKANGAEVDITRGKARVLARQSTAVNVWEGESEAGHRINEINEAAVIRYRERHAITEALRKDEESIFKYIELMEKKASGLTDEEQETLQSLEKQLLISAEIIKDKERQIQLEQEYQELADKISKGRSEFANDNEFNDAISRTNAIQREMAENVRKPVNSEELLEYARGRKTAIRQSEAIERGLIVTTKDAIRAIANEYGTNEWRKEDEDELNELINSVMALYETITDKNGNRDKSLLTPQEYRRLRNAEDRIKELRNKQSAYLALQASESDEGFRDILTGKATYKTSATTASTTTPRITNLGLDEAMSVAYAQAEEAIEDVVSLTVEDLQRLKQVYIDAIEQMQKDISDEDKQALRSGNTEKISPELKAKLDNMAKEILDRYVQGLQKELDEKVKTHAELQAKADKATTPEEKEAAQKFADSYKRTQIDPRQNTINNLTSETEHISNSRVQGIIDRAKKQKEIQEEIYKLLSEAGYKDEDIKEAQELMRLIQEREAASGRLKDTQILAYQFFSDKDKYLQFDEEGNLYLSEMTSEEKESEEKRKKLREDSIRYVQGEFDYVQELFEQADDALSKSLKEKEGSVVSPAMSQMLFKLTREKEERTLGGKSNLLDVIEPKVNEIMGILNEFGIDASKMSVTRLDRYSQVLTNMAQKIQIEERQAKAANDGSAESEAKIKELHNSWVALADAARKIEDLNPLENLFEVWSREKKTVDRLRSTTYAEPSGHAFGLDEEQEGRLFDLTEQLKPTYRGRGANTFSLSTVSAITKLQELRRKVKEYPSNNKYRTNLENQIKALEDQLAKSGFFVDESGNVEARGARQSRLDAILDRLISNYVMRANQNDYIIKRIQKIDQEIAKREEASHREANESAVDTIVENIYGTGEEPEAKKTKTQQQAEIKAKYEALQSKQDAIISDAEKLIEEEQKRIEQAKNGMERITPLFLTDEQVDELDINKRLEKNELYKFLDAQARDSGLTDSERSDIRKRRDQILKEEQEAIRVRREQLKKEQNVTSDEEAENINLRNQAREAEIRASEARIATAQEEIKTAQEEKKKNEEKRRLENYPFSKAITSKMTDEEKKAVIDRYYGNLIERDEKGIRNAKATISSLSGKKIKGTMTDEDKKVLAQAEAERDRLITHQQMIEEYYQIALKAIGFVSEKEKEVADKADLAAKNTEEAMKARREQAEAEQKAIDERNATAEFVRESRLKEAGRSNYGMEGRIKNPYDTEQNRRRQEITKRWRTAGMTDEQAQVTKEIQSTIQKLKNAKGDVKTALEAQLKEQQELAKTLGLKINDHGYVQELVSYRDFMKDPFKWISSEEIDNAVKARLEGRGRSSTSTTTPEVTGLATEATLRKVLTAIENCCKNGGKGNRPKLKWGGIDTGVDGIKSYDRSLKEEANRLLKLDQGISRKETQEAVRKAIISGFGINRNKKGTIWMDGKSKRKGTYDEAATKQFIKDQGLQESVDKATAAIHANIEEQKKANGYGGSGYKNRKGSRRNSYKGTDTGTDDIKLFDTSLRRNANKLLKNGDPRTASKETKEAIRKALISGYVFSQEDGKYFISNRKNANYDKAYTEQYIATEGLTDAVNTATEALKARTKSSESKTTESTTSRTPNTKKRGNTRKYIDTDGLPSATERYNVDEKYNPTKDEWGKLSTLKDALNAIIHGEGATPEEIENAVKKGVEAGLIISTTDAKNPEDRKMLLRTPSQAYRRDDGSIGGRVTPEEILATRKYAEEHGITLTKGIAADPGYTGKPVVIETPKAEVSAADTKVETPKAEVETPSAEVKSSSINADGKSLAQLNSIIARTKNEDRRNEWIDAGENLGYAYDRGTGKLRLYNDAEIKDIENNIATLHADLKKLEASKSAEDAINTTKTNIDILSQILENAKARISEASGTAETPVAETEHAEKATEELAKAEERAAKATEEKAKVEETAAEKVKTTLPSSNSYSGYALESTLQQVLAAIKECCKKGGIERVESGLHKSKKSPEISNATIGTDSTKKENPDKELEKVYSEIERLADKLQSLRMKAIKNGGEMSSKDQVSYWITSRKYEQAMAKRREYISNGIKNPELEQNRKLKASARRADYKEASDPRWNEGYLEALKQAEDAEKREKEYQEKRAELMRKRNEEIKEEEDKLYIEGMLVALKQAEEYEKREREYYEKRAQLIKERDKESLEMRKQEIGNPYTTQETDVLIRKYAETLKKIGESAYVEEAEKFKKTLDALEQAILAKTDNLSNAKDFTDERLLSFWKMLDKPYNEGVVGKGLGQVYNNILGELKNRGFELKDGILRKNIFDTKEMKGVSRREANYLIGERNEKTGKFELNDFGKRIESVAKSLITELQGVGDAFEISVKDLKNGITQYNFKTANGNAVLEYNDRTGQFSRGTGTNITDPRIARQQTALREYQKIEERLRNSIGRIPKEAFSFYSDKYDIGELQRYITEFRELINNPEKIKEHSYEELQKRLEELKDAYRDLNEEARRGEVENLGVLENDGTSTRSQLEKMAYELSNGSVEIKRFNEKNRELTYTMRTADDMVKTFTLSVDGQTKEISRALVSEEKYVSGISKFIDSLYGKGAELFRYVIANFSIYRVFGEIRQGLTVVREMDTAMTNLNKVSNDSAAALENFRKASFDIASSIGSTGKAVVDAATEWARLGYNIEEAAELAKASSVYANVGEIDATTATTDLVSALKAFKIDSDDVMNVVDVLNEIGNNYAVSSAELGQVLEKSSSALAVSGDSLEQVVAMGAAMNEVIQDASTTGSTLKILSLRLRGTKTDIEEAGEETDGMAESTSKLREKILALTNVTGKGGFDIMADENTYKTTYEIVKGIAQVWNDMSQIDQSALLELIAGKNRAQGVAALISNFAKSESALSDAMNASGSAMRENDKYMESINGHIAVMQNKYQQMWDTAINRDFVNFIVDAGSGVLDLVHDFGLLQTLVIGLIPAITTFNGAIGKMPQIASAKNYGIGDAGRTSLSILGTPITGGDKYKSLIDQFGQNIGARKDTGLVDLDTGKNILVSDNEWFKIVDEEAEALKIVNPELITYAKKHKEATLTGKEYYASLKQQGKGLDGLSPSIRAANIATGMLTTALNALINVGISAFITGAIYSIEQWVTAEERVTKAARELGDKLNDNNRNIEEYKSRITSLQNTINDSASSINDVVQAREELLNIQDELIQKYGNEESVVGSVTAAIYDQADALDYLKSKYYEDIINQYDEENTKGLLNWWRNFGDSRTIEEKIIDRVENYAKGTGTQLTKTLFATERNANGDLDLREFLQKSVSGVNINSEGDISFDEEYTNIYEYINKLNELIDVAEKYQRTTGTTGQLIVSQLKDELKLAENEIKEIGDAYYATVFNEKVLTNYSENNSEIEKAFKSYKDAIVSGNSNTINEAGNILGEALNDGISNAISNGDNDVAQYFKQLYPSLQKDAASWRFKVQFESDGTLKDNIGEELKKLGDITYEDFLADRTNYEYGTRNVNKIGEQFGFSKTQFADILLQNGFLETESFRELGNLIGGAWQNILDGLTEEEVNFLKSQKGLVPQYKELSFEMREAQIKELEKQREELMEERAKLFPEKVTGEYNAQVGTRGVYDFVNAEDVKKIDNELDVIETKIGFIKREGVGARDVLKEILKVETPVDHLADLKSYQTDIDNYISGMSAINTAMSEQANVGNLSASTVKSLTDAFGDENVVLERTRHGIMLNTQEMNNYVDSKMDKYVDTLKTKQKDLAKQYQEESVQLAFLNELLAKTSRSDEARIKAIQASIKAQEEQMDVTAGYMADVDALSYKLDQARNKFLLFKDAMSTENQGASFDYLQSNLSNIEEIAKSGRFNTDEMRRFVDMYTTDEFDAMNATAKEVREHYEEAMKLAQKYTTENPAEGLLTLLDDLKKIDDEDLVTFDDGILNIVDIDKTAQHLGMVGEALTILIQKMQEYDDTVKLGRSEEDVSDSVAQYEAVKRQVEAINEELKEINNGEVKFKTDADKQARIDLLEATLEEMQDYLNNSPVTMRVNAIEDIQKLQEQIDRLNESGVSDVNIINDLQTKQQELADKHGLDIKAIIHAEEDEQSKKNIELTTQQVQDLADLLNEDYKLKFNIDPKIANNLGSIETKLKGIKTAYNELPEAVKGYGVNGSLEDSNNSSTKETASRSGRPRWQGSAHWIGTALAHGNWNVGTTGKQLVGELGREMVVRGSRYFTVGDNGAEMVDLQPNDIVFNHVQTEELLKNGKINTRGKALANGTVKGMAFAGADSTAAEKALREALTYGKNGGSNNGSEAAKNAKDIEKSTEETSENIGEIKNAVEWLDRAISSIERTNNRIREEAESENNTYADRVSYYESLLASDEDMIKVHTDALKIRESEWDRWKGLMTDTFGTEQADEFITKIEMGNATLEEWRDSLNDIAPDDETAAKWLQLINDAIGGYDALQEVMGKLRDAEKKRHDDEVARLEVELNLIKSIGDEIQSEIDTINDRIDYKNTIGALVTEGDYKELIRQNDKLIDNYEDQISKLEEQRDLEDEGSAAWYSLNQQILSVESSIRQCEKQTAEWNEEILNIPIKRIESYLNVLKNIATDLDNISSIQQTLGNEDSIELLTSRMGNAKAQFEEYKKLHEEYEKQLNRYDFGSDKFEEASSNIQSCEDNMNSLVNSLREWNKQIMRMPIVELEKLNTTLTNIKNSVDEINSEWELATNTVVATIDREIDGLNELIKAKEEEAEAAIKPLQDQLDLMEKQNAARQRQLQLEQAQFNLAKAQQEKTIQVIRNGAIVWEANEEAIRDANQGLQDAQQEMIKAGLQDQIDAINDEKDTYVEAKNEEIEALEKVKERWHTLSEDIEYANDVAKTSEIFGESSESWIEKVLHQNGENDDELYNMTKANREAMTDYSNKLGDQIDQNEKMSAMMEQYVNAFMNGEMTYEEVARQYGKLLKNAEDGLTSQEHLTAQLAMNGDKSVSSAIKTIGDNSDEEYKKFSASLSTGNNNEEKIIKPIEQSTSELVSKSDELIKLKQKEYEENQKKLEKIERNTRRRGRDDDDDDDRDEWVEGKSGTGYGAHTKYNDSDHTDWVGDGIGKYAGGLEEGSVGGKSDKEKFKAIQSLGLRKLAPDEIPAILHMGEGVINPKQMSTLLKNVETAAMNPVGLGAMNTAALPNVTISMGDLTLPNVRNGEEFAKSLQQNFTPIMNQYFSKVF